MAPPGTDPLRERGATLESWRLDAEARPLGAVLELGDAQAHSTGIAVPQWNGLLLRRAPADEGLYAEAAAWFAALGMPYGVLVPAEVDAAPPGGLLLHEHPVWVRGPAGLPPLPALDYDDAAAAADVAAVQAAAFEDLYALDLAFVAPVLGAPWRRTVVVREHGAPVATACAVLTGQDAVVYDVAVLPSEQRRGLGRAVTLWCLQAAAALGRSASTRRRPAGRCTPASASCPPHPGSSGAPEAGTLPAWTSPRCCGDPPPSACRPRA